MSKDNNINLQLTSTIIFIIATLISLSITYNEKLNINNKKTFYSKKESLNISFYNRFIFIIAILISLYVAIDNYSKKEEKEEKYKSSLIVIASLITLSASLIILYVSYLNKKEETLTPSDLQNTLI